MPPRTKNSKLQNDSKNATAQGILSTRRHLDYTSARLRRAAKVSSLLPTRFTDLKTEKNGGFRADPLAKTPPFSFFRNPL